MIRSFRSRGTEDLFDGMESSAARRTCPRTLWAIAKRKLDQVNRVQGIQELAEPPGNRLELLGGDRRGMWSIRINDQYRICFRRKAPDAHEVEVTDYH